MITLRFTSLLNEMLHANHASLEFCIESYIMRILFCLLSPLERGVGLIEIIHVNLMNRIAKNDKLETLDVIRKDSLILYRR